MMVHQQITETHTPHSLADEVFDVLVVGAGVVGCAVARRLTLAGARVAVVEKATDILDGASKANSAILHTGFDAPKQSLELECVRSGQQEYHQLVAEMGLALEPCGANVVAWSDDELARLEGIHDKARDNGVTDTRMLSAASLHEQEPHLSSTALGSLFVPGESIIDPWSAPYAYLAQALENGAKLFRATTVTGGNFDGDTWHLGSTHGTLKSTVVINCAGLYGDQLEQSIFGEAEFCITPRKGQFVVFDKAAAGLISSIILPVPTDRTKGVVLFRTVFGNLAVGPTAQDQQSRIDTSTDTATLNALVRDGIRKLPGLATMPITATYAGLRPASEHKDYQLTSKVGQHWITAGGIRSTGLSGALGIAWAVLRLYQDLGLNHKPLVRPKIPKPKVLAEIGPRDWKQADHGEIVCHCERVTRREIQAALSGPLAARSLPGLKRQTRATMGRCQGFYCSARLAELTAGHFCPALAEEIDVD